MYLIVDRIEEKTAACETPHQGILFLPVRLLPDGIKEGDAVNLLDGFIYLDSNYTTSRSKRIKDLTEELFI